MKAREFRTGFGSVRMEPYGDNVVRVRVAPEGAAAPSASFCVRAGAGGGEASALSASVDEARGFLTWKGPDGTVLLRERGWDFEPREVMEPLRYNPDGVEYVDGRDGTVAVLGEMSRCKLRDSWRVGHSLDLDGDEGLYGLGQQDSGVFNLRGTTRHCYQQNLKVSMPVLVSSRGWAIFYDTGASLVFRDDAQGCRVRIDCADVLDYYFVYGPEFDAIVSALRELCGGASMLPRWMYGFIQSRERYANQEEILAVAAEYRRRGLPIDCVVQDWKYWPEGCWGWKHFDPDRFPDPAGMVRELHGRHLRLMLSIWPKLRGDANRDRQEMLDRGAMLGEGLTYDAFDPAARRLYGEQLRRELVPAGIDAWWCDCSEPFEDDWRGAERLCEAERYRSNTRYIEQFLEPTTATHYSLLHSRMLHDCLREAVPGRRVVNLTRSSSPGQQQYGAVTWSGDISARWEVMRAQLAEGLNFTVTGNPRWTLDIGGFFVRQGEQWFRDGAFDEGPKDPGYRELYLRWMQFGVFLPLMRSHGTDFPREVWHFGEEGEPCYEALRACLEWRYRLLPYIYSLAGWETHRGYTMMRSLLFDFREDAGVRNISDQFMFGPSLMVCPVFEPMGHAPGGREIEKASWTRSVYLPRGCDWYDFWTNERHAGGQWIEAAAPLERIPLFAPAGAILPIGPVQQYSDEKPDAPWQLRVYPGRDGSFDLYEDAGDGYGYEHGEYAWTRLRWHDAEARLERAAREGNYPGMGAERVLDLRVMRDAGPMPFA